MAFQLIAMARRMSNYQRHPVDAWCRETLARYPGTVAEVQRLYAQRADVPRTLWPEWCGLPMSAVNAILCKLAGHWNDPAVLQVFGKRRCTSDVTAALLWIRSKMVYRFDHDLLVELIQQPLDDNVPVESLLTLPQHCVFIDTRGDLDEWQYLGYFAWIDADTRSSAPELRLSYLMVDGRTLPVYVPLEGGILADTAGIGCDFDCHRDKDLLRTVAGDINCILYLCAENRDIAPRDGIHRPTDRLGFPKSTRIWDVGIRIGRALRRARAQEAAPRDSADGQHASPRAHIRRAHWLLYAASLLMLLLALLLRGCVYAAL